MKHIVKDLIFPGVMYGCESWTIKKAEDWIIDASKWWCWSPLDSKAISQPQKKLALNIQEWDVWMASPTWWTWVWASSGSQWWTGKPGVLQFMGSQRVGHDWVTELCWFIGRTDAGSEAPILWPPDANSQLIGKEDPDAGKDWGQEEKGATEDEMVGWHHWLNGREFG